jgi:hypothetical protein
MERRYFAAQQNQLLDFRVGSGTDILRTTTDVRYSLESGHSLERLERPLCASSGLMSRNKTACSLDGLVGRGVEARSGI